MSAKRGQTDLSGVLLVDKPSGMTSHDVVDRVRRATGERRVGHAGTLDPMATGLLVVLVGPATRLAPYLSAAEKTYDARIIFGSETDTDDADGRMTVSAPVPDELCDPFFAAGTVASLVGTHEQVPPAFSAIKRDGKVAYEAARAGEALELEARTIEVTVARLLGVDCERGCSWDVEFGVSKGTYIRALARDLGRALNTAAHLGALRRSRSGSADVTAAHSLDAIATAEQPEALFTDPVAALGLPSIELSAEDALRVSHGSALDVALAAPSAAEAAAGKREAPQPLAVTHGGVLLGVYARVDGQLKAQVVVPGGVGGVL